MARKKARVRIARLYSMSDATLIQTALDLIVKLTRDQAQLNGRGITTAVITALGTQTTAFDNLPDNNAMQEATDTHYATRNTAYMSLKELIDASRTMVLNVLGEDSPCYRNNYLEIFNYTEQNLGQKVKNMIVSLTTHQPELEDEGLTLAFIADLSARNEAYLTSVTNLNTALETANTATDNRTRAGNALWKEIVKRVKTAVTYYKYSDLPKADEYADLTRRDDTPASPPPAPGNVAVNVATGQVTYDAAENATSYKIEYKSPADTGTFVPAHEGLITTTSFTLPVQLVAYIIRVFAHNAAGFSPPSAEILASFGLATPGGFAYNSAEGKFVWAMLAGITFYRMEASYDGGATWQEISAQDFMVGEYVWNPPPGIFRLRAEDGSEVSAWAYATVA